MRVLILLRRSTINQEAADELRQRNWADISFSPGFNQVAAPCTSDPATVSTVFRENLSKTVETVNGGEKSPLSTRLKPGENDKRDFMLHDDRDKLAALQSHQEPWPIKSKPASSPNQSLNHQPSAGCLESSRLRLPFQLNRTMLTT